MHVVQRTLSYFGISREKVIKQETVKQKQQQTKIVACSRKGVTNKNSIDGRLHI